MHDTLEMAAKVSGFILFAHCLFSLWWFHVGLKCAHAHQKCLSAVFCVYRMISEFIAPLAVENSVFQTFCIGRLLLAILYDIALV